MDIGGRLRASRLQLGLTTQEVAERAGLSRSSVSQLESNKGNPSLNTLQNAARVVGLTLSDLVEEGVNGAEGATPSGRVQPGGRSRPPAQVVRRNRRKIVRWPGSNWQMSLLTPDVQGQLQVSLDEETPPDVFADRQSHEGEELGFVLQGTYEAVVGDETFILEEGDSIYLLSPTPHAIRVIGDQPGRMIWVLTPPDF